MAYQKKKLMFYISSLEYGGAERVMANLVNEFANRGYEVILINDYIGKKEYALNSKVKRIVLRDAKDYRNFAKKNIAWIWLIRKLCRKEKPIAVLSFLPNCNIRNVIAAYGLKTKAVISVRVDPKYEVPNKLARKIVHSILCAADGCVFQTVTAQSRYPRLIQKKSTVIPNPVADIFFNRKIARDRNSRTIMAAGRLVPQKNYPLLFRAFKNVHDQYCDVKLDIWGQGCLHDELVQLTKELQLDDCVCFKGVTSDMFSVYRKCLLYVLSSDFEGMPNTLMEAMACGCPVVSTDCAGGGASEIINDGENGYLVPAGDADALSVKMIKIMEDGGIREKFSKNAELAGEKFRSEIIFQKWEDFLLK